MNRYNQGFKKFGPMEQCSDGEWVRYEDVEAERPDSKDRIATLESRADHLRVRHGAVLRMVDALTRERDGLERGVSLRDLTIFVLLVIVGMLTIALASP